MDNISMYESPSSTMASLLCLLAFILMISAVSSGIVLAVWHLHRRAFDVTALSVQEWGEVAILLASSIMFAGYTCVLSWIAKKLVADSERKSQEVRARLAEKAAHLRHMATAIMGLYLFGAIIVSPYLEVHYQYESLSRLFREDQPKHHIFYLIGPLMLALNAYVYTVVIFYVQMDILSLLGKVVISGMLIIYIIWIDVINPNAKIIRFVVGFGVFPVISIVHSMKKVAMKWRGRGQLMIFITAVLYLAASIAVTWAVLRPGKYHMYLPVMMMIAIMMFATVMFFTSIIQLHPFDDKTPDERKRSYPKFGIFARIWIILPIVHYSVFDSQDSEYSPVLFAPLALEAFIALCWAGRYIFNDTFLVSVCHRFTKMYLVRGLRAIKNTIFFAASYAWDKIVQVEKRIAKYIHDRKGLQFFGTDRSSCSADVQQGLLPEGSANDVLVTISSN